MCDGLLLYTNEVYPNVCANCTNKGTFHAYLLSSALHILFVFLLRPGGIDKVQEVKVMNAEEGW